MDDTDLTSAAPHERVIHGIGYMPEDRGLVPELTVEENICLPLWVSPTLELRERLEFVYGVLPELRGMRQRKALLLSGGQQKMVALARALSIGTKLLLLDEPFEGVAPALSQRLSEVIGQLRGSGLSVLISQSDLNHSRDLLDAEVVIERGANMGAPSA
jgi:branched-chain amino acid transport system ATP-binding protein